MLAVLLTVSEGEVWGWASARTLVLGLFGLALLVVWVDWTLRSATPLVDLRMAVRPGIAAPNLVALVAGLGMYCLLTLSVVLVRADEPGFGLDEPVWVAGPDPGALLGGQRARQPARPRGCGSGSAPTCCCRPAA